METIKGRGAVENPPNRFERLHVEPDADIEEVRSGPATQFYKDASKTVIAHNDSPDIPFEASLNPYRGCEHGCVYCYARPTHEYLGFSAGLDFESRILVKEDAPELLKAELSSPRWKPKTIAISGVTDPYQPVERRLGLTRRCLEVLAACRNPAAVITKSHLISRDADLLAVLAKKGAAAAFLSITTLDPELARTLEPRASAPDLRLAAIETLARAGVPVGVMAAPVIPGLTDHEMPAIVSAAAKAGARFAGYIPLRLPHGVAPLFEKWLERHRPERKKKVLSQIRSLRGGKLNDPEFVSRMRGQGVWAAHFASLFALACRRSGMVERGPALSAEHFRRPATPQLQLFDV